MMNPIGVHFIPTHTGRQHYEFIQSMQPGIFKLVGSSAPDVQQIADGYAAAANALMYLRNVARSEQHDFLWRDPVRAAMQHVQEWHADIERWYQQARERDLRLPPIEQIRILGINEPVIELFAREEDMSNYGEWLAMMNERTPLLDLYMVTFGHEANRLGYGAGLGNISSGQPANKKPGEYATFDWFPRTRKLLESTRGLNAYTCHEYWRAETGPEGHADWHAWRFMHLNVDCDIDVLESGVDQQITDEDPHGNRGWRGHMDAAAYVDQHRRYIARARTDSRFRCETPFTLDGDEMWESFWIEYCMGEMIALSNEVRLSTTPQHTHLPQVGAGTSPAPSGIIEPRVAQAILRIESGGRTHGENGKPLIRFEAHIFVGKAGNTGHFRYNQQKPWTEQQWRRDANAPWYDVHTGKQVDEYAAFEFAKTINPQAAYQSISMGAGQIMGFNHARVGFASAEAMFDAFESAQVQTIAFINYFLSDPALVQAMQQKDWREIAKRYNGSGAVDTYAPLLEKAYRELVA